MHQALSANTNSLFCRPVTALSLFRLLTPPGMIPVRFSYRPFVILLVGWLCVHPAKAQSKEGPVIGVDWTAPSDFGDAASDLVEIAEVGFAAVRMPPVFDEEFYTLADRLGLTLYIELPLVQRSVRELRTDVAGVDSLLALVLDAGRGHAAAGPIGITRLSDTRSPGGCDAIRQVAERIRAAGRQAYYTSSFSHSDRCRNAVDFVLLDVLTPYGMSQSVTSSLDLAAQSGSGRLGITGLGAAVSQPQVQGWLHEGSATAQARFMETSLKQVAHSNLSHVFVHRWRDQPLDTSVLPDPWGRNYGLYTSESDPRPALQVVRGILRGLQDTFAFDAGQPADPGRPWFPALGWLMITLTAFLYAGSPRFRTMIPRYFYAHGFFRNAVREAREVLPLTSTAILTVIGLSVGLIASLVITGLKDLPLSIHWYRLLSPGSRTSLTAIMNEPFILTILIGSTTLLFTSLWMGCWMVVASRRARLLPSQALMLASWPRWQVLLLLPIAMTLEATPGVPIWALLCLSSVWFVTALWATLRTSYDLYKVTGISPLAASLVWLMHPLVLAVFLLVGWSLMHWDEVRFAWHLLMAAG